MEDIFAKSAPDWTTLINHLDQVGKTAVAFAQYLKLDKEIVYHGALLHDIGKVHPFFQQKLKHKTSSKAVFRHEIASLFFLSLFPKQQWNYLIEMVVAHHKSVFKDMGARGLLDLEANDDYLDFHLGDWEHWSIKAIELFNQLGFSFTPVSRSEAVNNLEYSVTYCESIIKNKGFSTWRGLLMGADYFASSLMNKTQQALPALFRIPNLSFYNRVSDLHPLSLKSADSTKRHTILIACTGSGKTDYLFRRTKGRVFYTLPFQASSNAMFNRVKSDLLADNPDLDIRILHAASKVVKGLRDNEVEMQNLIGASIKILTPHQLVSIILGLKGYESMILDLQGCDVIFDEVHTYSGASQSLVLKLIEALVSLGCNIHIGSATLPKVLYEKIKALLATDVYELRLEKQELAQFNRHVIHKVPDFHSVISMIAKGVHIQQKILIVQNTISDAQKVYETIKNEFPDITRLLIHSKFRRRDRNEKEKRLLGLDENGNPTHEFNTGNQACIVVATQVVEVSLDISFDLMVTATAPLDSLIQRFGRINRKRDETNLGKYKDIYVIAPPEDKKAALPYNIDILHKSFEVLPEGLLEEVTIQDKINAVFTELDILAVEQHVIFNNKEGFSLPKLTHKSKAILLELISEENVSCILQSDTAAYELGDYQTRINLEIPVAFWMVATFNQLETGNRPFVIIDTAYDFEYGLQPLKLKEA